MDLRAVDKDGRLVVLATWEAAFDDLKAAGHAASYRGGWTLRVVTSPDGQSTESLFYGRFGDQQDAIHFLQVFMPLWFRYSRTELELTAGWIDVVW